MPIRDDIQKILDLPPDQQVAAIESYNWEIVFRAARNGPILFKKVMTALPRYKQLEVLGMNHYRIFRDAMEPRPLDEKYTKYSDVVEIAISLLPLDQQREAISFSNYRLLSNAASNGYFGFCKMALKLLLPEQQKAAANRDSLIQSSNDIELFETLMSLLSPEQQIEALKTAGALGGLLPLVAKKANAVLFKKVLDILHEKRLQRKAVWCGVLVIEGAVMSGSMQIFQMALDLLSPAKQTQAMVESRVIQHSLWEGHADIFEIAFNLLSDAQRLQKVQADKWKAVQLAAGSGNPVLFDRVISVIPEDKLQEGLSAENYAVIYRAAYRGNLDMLEHVMRLISDELRTDAVRIALTNHRLEDPLMEDAVLKYVVSIEKRVAIEEKLCGYAIAGWLAQELLRRETKLIGGEAEIWALTKAQVIKAFFAELSERERSTPVAFLARVLPSKTLMKVLEYLRPLTYRLEILSADEYAALLAFYGSVPSSLIKHDTTSELKARYLVRALTGRLIHLTSGELSTDISSLKEKVVTQGLRLQDVSRDGNCFFDAVKEQLARIHDGKSPLTADEIRARAVAHIRENLTEFAPYIYDQTPAEFIGAMSQSREWVDEAAISAVTQALGVNVVILRLDGTQPVVYNVGSENTVFLAYGASHYLSIEEIDVTHPALVSQLKYIASQGITIPDTLIESDGTLALPSIRDLFDAAGGMWALHSGGFGLGKPPSHDSGGGGSNAAEDASHDVHGIGLVGAIVTNVTT